MLKLYKNSPTKIYQKVIDTLEYVDAIIQDHKGSYFWIPSMRAEQRRSKEFSKEYSLEIFGDTIEILLKRSDSAKNVYFTKNIYFNGNKTTVVKIRNISKKLNKVLEKRNAS